MSSLVKVLQLPPLLSRKRTLCNRCTDGHTDRRTDVRTYGRTDGRMDVWTYIYNHVPLVSPAAPVAKPLP